MNDLIKALAEGSIGHRELVEVQHFKISMAEIVSDLMALHESKERETYWQNQTDFKSGQVEIHTQVDRIIDLNNEIPKPGP